MDKCLNTCAKWLFSKLSSSQILLAIAIVIKIILLQFLEVNNNPVLKINLSKYNKVIIITSFSIFVNIIILAQNSKITWGSGGGTYFLVGICIAE